MKVYFDIITNHTADVIGYQSGDRTAYVSKDERPYTDSSGKPFDDRTYAGGNDFPKLDAATSFPYVPVLAPGEENLKVPAWLNDVTLYHNRGNSTFTGEDSQYGDFSGLDDLFTENPKVVDGMISIYETWIKDFGIDGFRIDTMKHVDDAFWQRFGPEVLDFAHKNGKDDFFMFGEVFDTSRALTSHYTTADNIQAVLDFPFQDAARNYASKGGSAQALADFFAGDDWYTDADSNAYQLPTFLGNHDMGRIGGFIEADNPKATATEKLAREDLIGTDATQGQDTYDTSQPLYETIANLASVTKAYPALRNGAQQMRYADAGSGLYAFSRIDRSDNREYLVVINNATEPKTAEVPTWSPSTRFDPVYGTDAALTTDDSASVSITVPPLAVVAYRATDLMPLSNAAPAISLTAAAPAAGAPDRMNVTAAVGADAYAEVSFWAKSGDRWEYIGTDDNAPYQVFQDVSALDPGTAVEYAAVVADNAGHTATSDSLTGVVSDPTISLTDPQVGATLGSSPVISATVSPDRPGTSVTFERRVGGGAWEAIGTDSSAPAYTFTDDASGIAPGTDVLYRAVVTQGAATVQSTAVSARGGAAAQPDEVALPGTVNSAMGCGEDWAPWCDQAQMALDPATSTWSITVDLPAGDYEYKIALNRTWDENFGEAGVRDGPNMKLSLTSESSVTFTYDNETHLVTVTGAA
jgi:glycosidase